MELPVMLVPVFVAARWIGRRFLAGRTRSARLVVGVAALVYLLAAEVLLGMALRGLAPTEALLSREPVSGTAYYLSLCVFALMPWALGQSG